MKTFILYTLRQHVVESNHVQLSRGIKSFAYLLTYLN